MKRSSFYIVTIAFLFLVGCVKTEAPQSDPNNQPIYVPTAETRVGANLISVSYLDDGSVTQEFNVQTEGLKGKARIFLFVNGYMNHFKLNDNNVSLYQDIAVKDLSTISVEFRPTVPKDGSEDVVSKMYVVFMDELNFGDSLYAYYTYWPLGVDVKLENGVVDEKNLVTVSHNYSRIINEDDAKRIDADDLKSLLNETNNRSRYGIDSKDAFEKRIGFDGFVYDANENYYLTKIGKSDAYVYLLLNGEIIMDGKQPLVFYFPESKDEILYTSLELDKLGFKKGDILSLLKWNISNDQDSGTGFIAVE